MEEDEEDFDEWLEEQKGNTDRIIVQKGTATKEEWLALLEQLDKECWDYEEID